MTARWSRRALVATGLLVPAMSVRAAPAAPRVAALDWGLAATVAALGAGPAAVAERAGYAQWVREPALPDRTAELGLRTAPSFETLAALRPGLILTNALNTAMRPQLERIAPVYASTIFPTGQAPVDGAIAAARDLGVRLGRQTEAEALIALAGVRFEAARDRLTGRPGRPIVPLGFINARHARVYGPGSLFADVMARIGLACGWSQPTNGWGFSIIAIEALAACRDADLMVVQPVPADVRATLDQSGLWTSLVAANRARVTTAPPIWAFGDITAAMHCADVLADTFAPPTGATAPDRPDHG